MKKRIKQYMWILAVCLGLLVPDTTLWAAAGKTAVSVSSNSVNIGDTVTVTGKAAGPSGEKVLATMTLSWDAGVLEFVSCSVDSNGGGGSRLMNGDSFTITLKAVAAGTSAISLSATDGVLFDTVESLDSMEASSASVTVNNAAGSGNNTAGGGTANGGGAADGGNNAAGGGSANGGGAQEPLSADNSLKSLTISPGTLSPSFAYNKTSYTATVASDVKSIAVSAVPANAKAVVESVTGNENLKEGTNTIKVVVKAENGVTAAYTIKVTKQQAAGSVPNAPEEGNTNGGEAEPSDKENTEEYITVNGVPRRISEAFKEEDIPVDFAESEINYHGKTYKGVSYTKGALKLLWMVSEEDSGSFFVYDETRDSMYPFVRFSNGENYVIALAAPVDAAIPEQYLQTSLAVDDTHTIAAYQKAAEGESEILSEFYIFYGVNQSGTEQWYQYDTVEGTYQRLSAAPATEEENAPAEDIVYLRDAYNTLSEKYTSEKNFARTVIAVLVFVIAVLAIVAVNLLIYRLRGRAETDLWEEAEEEEEEEEQAIAEKPRREHAEQKKAEEAPQDAVQKPSAEKEAEGEAVRKDVLGIRLKDKGKKEQHADDLEVIDLNNLE